jgi:hypothetical protein
MKNIIKKPDPVLVQLARVMEELIEVRAKLGAVQKTNLDMIALMKERECLLNKDGAQR